MSDNTTSKVVTRNFSSAFEQMCNFVAVARTGDVAQTIQGLITICLLRFPEDRRVGAADFATTIDSVFGISVPHHQIELALISLQKKGMISCPSGNFVLLADARTDLAGRCDAAFALERRVREAYLQAVQDKWPELNPDTQWMVLRKYLARAFRRHGLQAAALLDPTIDTPSEYDAALSLLLDDVLRDSVEPQHTGLARQAISSFFSSVGSDPERSRYITQLADGAFNFFSLEIDPALSFRLREKLRSLVLFLDTNFLFGILGLSYNQQVEVSLDLLRMIKTHKLPFSLRYHNATQRELRSTISHYGSVLQSRDWSQMISRVAVKNRSVSGIERRFHEQNAERRIDVTEFLRQYQHCDVLLKEKGIEVFNAEDERLTERADLHHEYQTYLENHGRSEKTYETVQHDATLLDAVRHKRTKASSSLEAGALIVSCDYYLYRFDWESSRRRNERACVVLPNIFWQLLRPFTSTDTNFEKSFAETFALPEFRIVGSGGTKACSKMLAVLASYRDLPEDTAEQLLSNDTLLDQLRTVDDEGRARELVDSAIATLNTELLEERAAYAKALKQRETELQASQTMAKAKAKALETSEQERSRLAAEVDRLRAESERTVQEQQLQAEAATAQATRLSKTEQQLQAERQARSDAEADKSRHARSEKLARVAGTIAVSVLLLVLVIGVVHYASWDWVRNHKNTVPIQIAAATLCLTLPLGLFFPSTRKWAWGGGLGTGLLTLLIGKLS